MRRHALRFIIGAFLACSGPSPRCWASSPPYAVQFNRDIRPILSDNCFQCHGPDKDKRKAKLRLDTKEGLFGEIEGRHPIVPGQLDQSEVYRRITTTDPDELMPQPKSGKVLSPQQIALIKRWIEQGAKWEGHWAYIPPTRPPVPLVRKRSWPQNPIDHFVLARLEAEGLHPSPEADPRTLIRRLSFDLTGLPPTPEEVAAFSKDKSPHAYEKLVDRLLASPHYGERMAMHWLDLVRYADTDGFHADNYRSVFPYRDYVIRAFNDNMPFDRFTVEQIAGDLLPNATMTERVASTYNRLYRTTEEGGAQPKEYLAKYSADRVRTTSTVWLGSTVGCAECHDHKFDPFTAKDFYSLAAFFADLKEQGVGKPEGGFVLNDAQAVELKRLDSEIPRWQEVLDTPTPALNSAQAQWEQRWASQPPPHLSQWQAIGPFHAESFDAAYATVFDPEKEIDLAKSYRDGKLKWKARPEWEDGKVHGDLKGENAATYLYRTITAGTAQPLSLALGSDDSIKVWLNGKEVLAHHVSRGVAPDQENVTVQLQAGENKLLMKIVNGSSGYGFYFKPGASAPENIAGILKVAAQERTEKQKDELTKYFRSITPELDETRAQLAATKKQKDEFLKNIPTTLLAMTVEPRVMRILPRGNWMNDSGDIVTPALPEFLAHAPAKEGRATRLDLAQWLASRDNPLAARVFVNRLWRLYFGTGLSKNLDDLGAQGEWPKHPGLLDWLAVEFMESGWDIKHLVKLIVLSNVYRQSSLGADELRERDPDNRLLARQSRFRLDAEIVRDNALFVSGLLAGSVGGPSVKPYQPAGYWDQLNFPKRTYESDHGAAAYRRGLYTYWCRTFLHPSLLAFDAPSREECTANRVTSNTPLQALVLLNDPTYVEAARVFAERILRKGGPKLTDRLNWAFSQALDRKPTRKEIEALSNLCRKELERYTADQEAAGKLIRTGEWPVPKDLDATELAAWTSVSRVILNLHETITRS